MSDNALSKPVRESLRNARICWFASASGAGSPCVAPKEVFADYGDSIILADLPNTDCIVNVRSNSRICLSFIDPLRECGYRIYAEGRILEPGADGYEERAAVLRETAGLAAPFRTILELRPTSSEAMPEPVARTHPKRNRARMMEEEYPTENGRD